MESIGGYFTLELPLKNQEYHPDAIAVNSGKNAFEYILASYGFKVSKLYLPYFTSRIMVKPLQEHKIQYEFYHINEQLEIVEDIKLLSSEFIVYTNYFGLKGTYVSKLAAQYREQLIVDNAQAFFEKPLWGVNTFYSPRKFFGVLDGGYAYTLGKEKLDLMDSKSYDRMGYLLKRIDTSAEDAYADYKSSCLLGDIPVMKMSKITQRILGSIDYEKVSTIRINNYLMLHKALADTNILKFEISDSVPLVYPYLSDEDNLRQRLIANKIYVAQYWPNVLEWCKEKNLEYKLTKNIIPLPIDQRYNDEDMNKIIEIICK